MALGDLSTSISIIFAIECSDVELLSSADHESNICTISLSFFRKEALVYESKASGGLCMMYDKYLAMPHQSEAEVGIGQVMPIYLAKL